MKDVYIHTATTSRITSKPELSFYELCLETGRKSLEGVDPRRIGSFYVACMDPAVFGVKGEFQASVAEELGLQPKEMLTIRGTSSAGGIGCIPGYKDIASGYHDYSLIISCEQMNRPTSKPRATAQSLIRERTAIEDMLKGVVDHDEQLYGLTMILVGDMIERALLHYLGLSLDQFREIIPKVTLEMYRRAARYPFAHFYGNTKTAEDCDKGPWVSKHYRRDDVVPTSTGACALVLSCEPPPERLGRRVVRLEGVGQGFVHPALARRFGPVTNSASVRRALAELCTRADIALPALQQVDLGFPHDAFPSISRLILKEMGYSHDQSIEGLLSGRFNPCGGLLKCGHPVGCSGEMQIVRAFQQMSYDGSAISSELQCRPADRAFTVSVGAALTNIVATYLTAHDRDAPPPGRGPGADESTLADYVTVDGLYQRYEEAMARLPEGKGVVLTGTRTQLGCVSLIQRRDTKLFALSPAEMPVGALVTTVRHNMGLNQVAEVVQEQAEPALQRDLGIVP